MRDGGSKAKGSSFERQVCRDLSMWMSHRQRDDLFWRSAMSGGRASVQFKKGKQNRTQTGDITAIDPLGEKLTSKFLIECKFYRDLQLQAIYTDAEKAGLSGFWRECERQAMQYDKFPMLIAKQNRTPTLLCLNFRGLSFLFDQSSSPSSIKLTEHVMAIFPRLDVYILWYKDFLLHAERPT